MLLLSPRRGTADRRFLAVAFNSQNYPSRSHGISRSLFMLKYHSQQTNELPSRLSLSLSRSRAETEEEMKNKEKEKDLNFFCSFNSQFEKGNQISQ
jgi:hypothetical protein